ncbi:hypothetical protein ACVRZD_07865 [Streptococcus hongkongensis]|nr:hypothetical protein NC01_07590 [Streptococcus uberis]
MNSASTSATTTVEIPQVLSGTTIRNTSTSTSPMVTLGSAYGAPTSAPTTMTNMSTGSTVSTIGSPSIISTGGGGYSWSSGAFITGFNLNKGYGITINLTVPVTASDTTIKFTPYATQDGSTLGNYFGSTGTIVIPDSLSQSTSTSKSVSTSISTSASKSTFTSTSNSKSSSLSASTSTS